MRMRTAVLLTMLVGVVLVVLAFMQHFAGGVITADHVAIAFAIIGLVVLTLGAFMMLTINN
jgi:hypothetical protein